MNKVPRWVFRYVGNKTFDFSSKKKGFFAPKRPNLAQNWLFLSIAGSFEALLVGWLVVVARAVSRKTPIYFIIINIKYQERQGQRRAREKSAACWLPGIVSLLQ